MRNLMKKKQALNTSWASVWLWVSLPGPVSVSGLASNPAGRNVKRWVDTSHG